MRPQVGKNTPRPKIHSGTAPQQSRARRATHQFDGAKKAEGLLVLMYGAGSVPTVRKYSRHRIRDVPTPEILVPRPRVDNALKYARWMMARLTRTAIPGMNNPRVAPGPEGRSNPVKGKAHVQHPERVDEPCAMPLGGRADGKSISRLPTQKMAESVQRRGKGETATHRGSRATMDPVVHKNRHPVGYGEAKRPPLR
jgi:hypothetical protein